MPFDYNNYQKKVNNLSTEQLQKEWENYTRQIAGGATSTGAAVLFSPMTAGISLIGLGVSTPRIHNARKKRAIIEKGLQERGATHNTRKRDVALPMAISGGIAGLTLGLAGPGADMLGGIAAEKGAEYLVSHVALDGTGAVIEHVHTEHEKKNAEHKLQTKLEQQYPQQTMVQGQQINGQSGLPIRQVNAIFPPLQHQPQFSDQSAYEPTYAPVPIPAIHSGPSSYQPASRQQQLVQTPIQPQMAQAHNDPRDVYQPEYQQQVVHPQIVSYQLQSFQQVPQLDNQNVIIQNTAAPLCAGDPPVVSQIEKHSLVTVPSFSAQAGPVEHSYFPEKSAAYNASIPQIGQEPCQTPAPAYSEDLAMQSQIDDLETNTPTDMTMEEEIALLKARLLAMELEKRGVVIEIPLPTIAQSQAKHNTPVRPISLMQSLSMKSDVLVSQNLVHTITEASTRLESAPVESPKQPEPVVSVSPVTESVPRQSNSPPPASLTSVSAPLPTRTVPVQPEQHSSPPPPPVSAPLPIPVPLPMAQYCGPPPPPQIEQFHEHQTQPLSEPEPFSPNTYNPQNWATPPQTCPLVPTQIPSNQRHDSGYFSASQTPLPRQYTPISPADTPGQYFPHQRIGSVSTMSPPPPYYPPPPVSHIPNANGVDNNYFYRNTTVEVAGGQKFEALPPAQSGRPPMQTYQGNPGWQWGAAAPVRQEPNYGPPPPVPTVWR